MDVGAEGVSLDEALAHGDADHRHGYPWRIRKGQPQVGHPRFNDEGEPKMRAGKLVLDWEDIPVGQAHRAWVKAGWILR